MREHKGIKKAGHKFGFIMLVSCFWILLVGIPVFAASRVEGFQVTGLSATYDKGSWKGVGTNGVNGLVEGTEDRCGNKEATTGTLTLKNTSSKDGSLNFKYRVSALTGSIQIGSETITEKGEYTYSKSIAKEGSLEIRLTSGSGSSQTTQIEITQITFVEKKSVMMTFGAPVGKGSYTVKGTNFSAKPTASIQNTQDATEGYTLTATPKSGYKLQGWYSEGKQLFISADASLTTFFGENDTVYPVFISENTPVWAVGTKWFTDLNEALHYAETKTINLITLIADGTLAAGTYEVKSGYTLLIPMDDAKTNYTGADYGDDGRGLYTGQATPAPFAFRTLTMETGATIEVYGTLNVASKISAKGQANGNNGTPKGPHGEIDMCTGSAIKVKSAGILYAFGFITGDGDTSDKTKGIVTVESGGLVHECFQIKDFRGGTRTSVMVTTKKSDKVFPFYQYYVQNIETPLILEAGAKEYVYSAFYINKGNVATGAVPFVGGSDSGLFRISSGHIQRTYDSKEDRIYYDVYGDVALGKIELSFNYVAAMLINSADYVLPINENIELTLYGNSTATVQQDLGLLPGVKFIIGKDSKFNIDSGYNCYVYDTNDWVDTYYYTTLYTVDYTAAKKGPRKTPKASATIDVNGEVQVSGGFYTTADGANIISSNRMGRVTYNTAVPETNTQKLKRGVQSGNSPEVPITSARLRNDIANPQYTDTTGTAAGTTYVYMEDRWGKPIKITFDPGTGGTGTLEPISTVIGKEIKLPTKDDASAKLTRAGYRITGWNTAADGSGTPYDLGALKSFDDNVTLYAQWVIAGYKLKFLKGADAATGEMPDQSFESEAESVTLNACAFTYDKHAFSGWVDQDGKTYNDQEVIARENLPTKDLTLTAQWVRVGYTITYKNGGGYEKDTTQDYDVRYEFTLKKGNYTRMNYKFIGWSETNGAGVATYKDEQRIPAGSLAKDMTLYAVWQELPVVTFDYNYDAAPGSNPVHVTQTYEVTMETPSRDRYRFDGWAKTKDGEVEFEAGQKCIFKESITLYARWTREVTITFKANDADATPSADHIVYGYEGENVTMPDATLFSHKYYELLGWDADSTKTANPTYTFGQVIQTPTEDMTLYAIWRHPAYDITITWEPLKFNYIRTYKWNPNALKYEQIENSWRNENQAGELVTSGAGVEIINKSQDPLSRVSATVTYVPKEGFASYLMQYGTSAGVFNNTLGEGDRAYKTGVLSCNGVVSQKIYLMLGNQPDKALDKAIVGTVNVSFQREPKI